MKANMGSKVSKNERLNLPYNKKKCFGIQDTFTNFIFTFIENRQEKSQSHF